MDEDACTNVCVAVICGDTIVWVGVEVCDDGNEDSTDACTSGCLLVFCGDGFV